MNKQSKPQKENNDKFCNYPKTENKSGWKWDANTCISLSAMLIALVGLGLSLWEGFENRGHNRLSVRPKMTFSYFYDDKEVWYELQNRGLGPAVIKWFEVRINGQLQKDWKDMFNALGIDYNKANPHFTVPMQGSIFQPGIPSTLFAVNINTHEGQLLMANLDNIDLKICFCSMYDDDCFSSTHDSRELNIKDSCKKAPEVFFRPPPRIAVIK